MKPGSRTLNGLLLSLILLFAASCQKEKQECGSIRQQSFSITDFKRIKAGDNLALDGTGDLVYIAPTRVNLDLTIERWPDIQFHKTREH